MAYSKTIRDLCKYCYVEKGYTYRGVAEYMQQTYPDECAAMNERTISAYAKEGGWVEVRKMASLTNADMLASARKILIAHTEEHLKLKESDEAAFKDGRNSFADFHHKMLQDVETLMRIDKDPIMVFDSAMKLIAYVSPHDQDFADRLMKLALRYQKDPKSYNDE